MRVEMNKKMLLVVGLGFLSSLLFLELEPRRRTKEDKPAQVMREAKEELDIEMYEDTVEPSLAEEVSTAAKEEPYDIEGKKKAVVKLVKDAAALMKEKPLYQALREFNHGKDFKRGELYVFVNDLNGICLANGRDENAIWNNEYDLKDERGTFIFQEMLKAGKQDSGWITYYWRHATKISYIVKVTVKGEDFLIGAGFYPHSKEASVINLVKGAVALFNQNKKEGHGNDRSFSLMSYPGRFVLGDLYLYALSFKGRTVAHGERPGLVGTDALQYRDATGRYINKEIIEKLQKTDEGVWVEYISKRAPKRTYAEKIKDNEGNEYFVACGYYPDADQKQAVDLVRKGYTFMKSHGLTQAVNEFSNLSNNEFRYGDLYLTVFNLEGICKAHGTRRDLIGKNMYNEQDPDGLYYVREIIAKAKAGGGWVSYKSNNLFRLVYVEPIDLGVDKFAILSGVFPVSKMETMMLLAKSAASFLRMVPLTKALNQFVQPGNRYISGDLSVFVFDSSGICLAMGDDFDPIWKNMIDVKDDEGRPWVKLLINTGVRGAGKVTFTLHGKPTVAYVEKVEKEGHTLIVGSHYFK